MPTANDPFPYFPEAGTGGYIYIGAVNQDAQTNPITVYRDAGLTLPWAQPIRTVDGYPAYQGAKANIYTSATSWSITVKNGNGETVTKDNSVIGVTSAADVNFTPTGTGAVVRTVQSKLRETVSSDDFGALGNGVADDTTAVNNATAAVVSAGVNGELVLSGTYRITSWPNPYGIRTTGPGKIVLPITGGVQQLNSYADVPGRIVYGKEYLFRVFQRAALGQSGTTGRIGCFLYGDSTVANGYMTQSTVSVLTRLFQMRGVGNITFTNRGVAGTQVSDLNVLPDLSTTTDLIIIKYGINDGTNPDATRLATFQSTFDAKLAAIRAASNGVVANLAIVLVGPNSTSDTPNGRDERWYEQLRGVYVTLARKYQCCYIDTYAAFRDSRGAAGLWQDNPYGDGRAIHPLDSLGYQIWSLVADTIITRDEAAFVGSGQFVNVSSQTYAPAGGAVPSQFGNGHWHGRAQLASGWPIDGFVIHQRNPDQGALQFLYPFAANNTRMLIRTANVGSDTWNRWTSSPENLTLANSWVAAGTISGTTYATPSAYVDVSGTVHLRGGMKSGTTTVGTQIGTMPAGMLPAADVVCTGTSSTGTAVAFKVAASNGAITLFSAGDATVTSLDGIRFLAA